MTTANVQFHPPVQGGTVIIVGSSTDAGAPPEYEDALNPNAPPPSYDSLFERVRQAEKISKRVLEFLQNIIIIIGCTIILGGTIVIPVCMILMIVMASIYLHVCRQAEYIPVYLLVGGIIGIIKKVFQLSEEWDEERQSPTQSLLKCMMAGWFIIGIVWVYKEYESMVGNHYDSTFGNHYDSTFANHYDSTFGDYCNKDLDEFAFWLIMSQSTLLGTVVYVLNYLYPLFFKYYLEDEF